MATRLERAESPLIVIVGPTASGKTAAAVEIAKEIGAEIICADSRTVYKGMDIGTAKPTPEEQATVPHWGLDLVEPGERFTAANFKAYAIEKVADIRARGHVPLIVGGTGLYIDAVVFDYEFGRVGDGRQRRELDRMSVEELQEYCMNNNVILPENTFNKRYIIRAIEQGGVNNRRRSSPISTSNIVGIATNQDVLRTRIADRSEHILTNGVVEEAILLGKKYGWASEAMTGNIYPLIHSYLKGAQSLDDIKTKFTTLDWHLAKRQLTWFRRNPYILWLTKEEVVSHVRSALATEQKS